MSFVIATDTSANLPTAYARKHGIPVVPFSFYMNGEEKTCTDTESYDCKAYFDLIRQGLHVTTSQVTPQRFIEYFEPVLQEGKDIIFVSMSSGVSGSCGSAHIAAQELMEKYEGRQIRIIDTLGASLGEGLIAMRGVDCREKGMSFAETADYLDELRHRVFNVFTVEDLMHLKRGGRLSPLSAVLGTVLNIKPILKGNEEGKIVAYAKTRGRKKVINVLAEKYDAFVRNPSEQTVCISHCDCPEEAEYLKELIMRNNPPRDVLIVEHEPATGSYLGPGALAIYYESFDGVRYDNN